MLLAAHYGGTIYFDTFPVLEDPVRECEWNVRITERHLASATALASSAPASPHDAFNLTRVIEQIRPRPMTDVVVVGNSHMDTSSQRIAAAIAAEQERRALRSAPADACN